MLKVEGKTPSPTLAERLSLDKNGLFCLTDRISELGTNHQEVWQTFQEVFKSKVSRIPLIALRLDGEVKVYAQLPNFKANPEQTISHTQLWQALGEPKEVIWMAAIESFRTPHTHENYIELPKITSDGQSIRLYIRNHSDNGFGGVFQHTLNSLNYHPLKEIFQEVGIPLKP